MLKKHIYCPKGPASFVPPASKSWPHWSNLLPNGPASFVPPAYAAIFVTLLTMSWNILVNGTHSDFRLDLGLMSNLY